MAKYISLIKFTEKGARTVKATHERALALREFAEKSGVEIEGQYWTMGAYDGVLVIRADKPENALRYLTELLGSGNVTTETMPAFDSHEIKGIVG